MPKLVITDPDGFRFVLEREQQQETTTSLCWWQEVEMKLALSRLLTTMTPRRVSVLADKASHGAKGRKKWSVDAWKEGGTLPGVEEKWSRVRDGGGKGVCFGELELFFFITVIWEID